MLVMRQKPGIKLRRAAAAARRAAAAYEANQEDLRPLVRLVTDVHAILALARGHRDKPAPQKD